LVPFGNTAHTFAPGRYIFCRSFSANGGAVLNAPGSMFWLPNATSLDLSGGVTINAEGGVFFAPQARVLLGGGSTLNFASVIAMSFDIQGNTGIGVEDPAPPASTTTAPATTTTLASGPTTTSAPGTCTATNVSPLLTPNNNGNSRINATSFSVTVNPACSGVTLHLVVGSRTFSLSPNDSITRTTPQLTNDQRVYADGPYQVTVTGATGGPFTLVVT
jgi:hypothetical protein